eukprot:5700406-Prorocentrum_lima.AAC.1
MQAMLTIILSCSSNAYLPDRSATGRKASCCRHRTGSAAACRPGSPDLAHGCSGSPGSHA